VIHGIARLGLEWRSILRSCGIDPELLGDADARIPEEAVDAFWPRAAELTGDPLFGLHVGEQVRPLAVNIIGYLLMSSPTVREGLERVVRFQRLVIGREDIAFVDRPHSSVITIDDDALGSAVQIEYRADLILKFLDWITAIDFRANEVRFRHSALGDRSEYERVLGCPVKFECEGTELVLPEGGLDQPSLHANPEIAEAHEEYAERHLAQLRDQSIARRVMAVLMAHLEEGPIRLGEAARSLYMSPRTLQRRLAEEGQSFHEIVESLRRNLCLHHLENPNVGLAEIAYIAGFSDPSAFTRAVRRWTGRTPLEYRREHTRH
jgi:AraC-like DNA-binding protein